VIFALNLPLPVRDENLEKRLIAETRAETELK
jgi:hypothetical protein